MKASVTWHGGLSFKGTSDSGFEVNLGADKLVGGSDDGFRPLELMAISLAGCTAMDVISILQKKLQTINKFVVSAHAERAIEHPKVFTKVSLLYKITGDNVDEIALRRAIELSATKYCPAQAMLGKIIPMEIYYQISNTKDELITQGIFLLPVPGK